MATNKTNSTERFSDRVANYVKYRPTYPVAILEFLKSKLSFSADKLVVDVGSGTGISTELFLNNGNFVYAVEPNESMRLSAEYQLSHFKNFASINGSSDSTGLPDKIADFIVAAQAFHWFEPVATKKEFKRILKPNGYAVLIWNDRKTTDSEFSIAYENLINKFSSEYKKINHKNIDPILLHQFLGDYEEQLFENFQQLNFEGLLGRLTSSSYAPNTDHPRFPEMKKSLQHLFTKYENGGFVRINYETKMYYSPFACL